MSFAVNWPRGDGPARALPRAVSRADPRRPLERLWLALHFHGLPLRAARSATASDEAAPAGPVAVFEVVERVQRIIAVQDIAARAGVAPGMKTGEARAVCPGIDLLPRDRPREQLLLEALANVLGAFSAEVAVADELCLVLEAGRSRRLFGGIDALIEQLGERLAGAPAYHDALAPTAGAAVLCARCALPARFDDPGQLRSRLGNLPAAALVEDPRQRRLLDAMGITTLRELFRLPRQGLARRLGPGFARQLDELLGERPHAPRPHRFRRCFEACLHFDEETDDEAVILQGARRLLARLENELRQCDSAVNALRWTLDAARAQDRQTLVLRLGTPAWRADALTSLLALRLASVTLTAPVRRITLRSDAFTSRSRAQQQGLPTLARAAGQDHEFIDRLRSRLGEAAVRGIRPLPEHRPEYAWTACEPGATPAIDGTGPARPLWLLPAPAPLTLREGHPRLGGSLRLGDDTERIRCGWWDGHGMFRDYRQALTPGGQRVWVFREPLAGRWFLHGVY